MGSLWLNVSQYPLPGCSSRTPNIQGRYNAPTIECVLATILALCSKLELRGMRGIACTVLITCLFSCKAKLGESPKTTLFLLASIWILMSWDCRGLHMSNTPISLVIRMSSLMSTLTSKHHSHPHSSTLVITREHNRIILLNWHQLSHWFVQDFAIWITWEHW